MKKKIFRVIMYIIYILLILLCLLVVVQMNLVKKNLVEDNRDAGNKVRNMSEEAMSSRTREILIKSSQVRAGIADGEFYEFIEAINIIAKSAHDIYLFSDKYGAGVLKKYNEADRGDIVTYVAFGDGVDPDDPAIKKEVALLSNMQGMMTAINESNDSMATDCFATESGIFMCAEAVSDYNIPKDNKPLYFESRQRPWYLDAVEAGKPVFTGIIEDADTGEPAVTCGIPVYVNGVLKGVAGSGLRLNAIRESVDSFHIGENGYACIVNTEGQILFSGDSSGELAAYENNKTDLRKSSNKELASLAKDALSGSSDVRVISMDEEKYYVAYSPMEAVGWSYFTILPEKEVLAPSQELAGELNRNNAQLIDFIRNSVFSSILTFIVLLIIIAVAASVISTKYASKLAAPVVQLTDAVSKLEGDNLEFVWDIDTGDEVQTLAESFESMTVRMKQYIEDITAITAERERIGAELSVATHIQASMLPSVFPPFPDRKEFDLYAKMDPAKEVGGDFYDFFMVDDDHIALVIADVSGKGVPAALFMVISKVLIKNHAKTGKSIEDVFTITNEQLCEGNSEEFFVTAWIGVIDIKTGIMNYCDAGHEIPYIIHADRSISPIKPEKKKPPIATMEGIKYISYEEKLNEGDCLFLYTDGVPEATNSRDELYGTGRLKMILKDRYNDDVESLLHDVRADVDEFVAGAPQFDDLTMLAFRYIKREG